MKRRPFARGRAVRHKPGEMNGLETTYSLHLTDRRNRGEIDEWAFESVTFKLAEKTRYTPDFLVRMPDGELQLHETKGFLEGDAWVKMKFFAEKFNIRLFLVKAKAKRDGGGWEIKEVGPKE